MRRPLPLFELDERIEQHSRAIREEHGFWPCRRGCDRCCRTLSRLPVLVEAEWRRLREALTQLDAEARADIERQIRSAADVGPLVCPMLDAEGSCQVYAARPIECRTHGFYTERDAGLHCAEVLAAVEEHAASDRVVWGNGESIADALRAHGAARSLREWVAGPR